MVLCRKPSVSTARFNGGPRQWFAHCRARGGLLALTAADLFGSDLYRPG